MNGSPVLAGLVGLLGSFGVDEVEAALTTNSWFLFSGKWEAGANWSAGTPHPTNAVNTITNDLSSIVVTMDTTTVTQHVINSCMTISNLFLGRGAVISHTLFMNNANNTPGNIGLTILSNFFINPTGILTITNSDLRVTNPTGGLFIDGVATHSIGMITVTNLSVGHNGTGSFTFSSGTMTGRNVSVAANPGSKGTLSIAGGAATMRNLSVGLSGLTGAVWLTGGQLTVSNESTAIGDPGVGIVTVSNGTWKASIVSHRQGTLTIAGGTLNIFNLGIASGAAGLTATVWMVGGDVATTNSISGFPSFTNDIVVGFNGIGEMTMSNGLLLTRNLYVASNATARGTFTMAGGTNLVTSSLSVGGFPGATGAVWLTGGRLVVTNAATIIGHSGVAQLTVSNGTFLAHELSVGTNTGSQGTFTVAGGANTLNSFLRLGDRPAATGVVWVTDGQLAVTNSPTVVGVFGIGQLTLSNGVLLTEVSCIGSNGGSQGTLTIAGGTNFVNGGLQAGLFVAATGSVWVTGGALLATNSGATIGVNGVGQLTISNGVWRTLNVVAGLGSAASGTLTFAGGTTEMASLFLGSNSALATGTVWVTGGELLNQNGAFIGLNGVGRVTVSNGNFQAPSVLVAQNAGSKANLIIAGGTNSVANTLIVGNANCTSTGIVTLTGGHLYITNASFFGRLDVRSGTFTQSGGLLLVDQIIVTNACGRFIRTGGSTLWNLDPVLTPALDADGDGIPNFADPGPFNPTDTGDDPDGDGQTNLEEFLAGTNPTNSASFLGITAIAREGNDIRVTWMTAAGKTNALERTAGVAGSFTNNFTGLTNIITAGTTTNVLDLGAATNAPAFYYRVRLVP